MKTSANEQKFLEPAELAAALLRRIPFNRRGTHTPAQWLMAAAAETIQHLHKENERLKNSNISLQKSLTK